MARPAEGPLANFEFSKIGKPPSLLGRLAPADPNIPPDLSMDSPPSPPPPAAASPELSTASLGRLAALLPSRNDGASYPQLPNIQSLASPASPSSQNAKIGLSISDIVNNVSSHELASFLWEANNSVPASTSALPSSTPTSFYFRVEAPPANPAGASTSPASVSSATSSQSKPSVSQLKAKSSSPQATGVVQADTPSRPPEQQPSRILAETAYGSTPPAASPTTSSGALRLAEDLRDARIELDEVRRTRERVVDEFKEFLHRYQETLHALEREKAQMERLAAVTEEWFGKAEKMVERREVKLSEDQALCAKRAQEEEEEKEKAESEARAAEEKRLEEEERVKVDAERAAAEDREKGRLVAEQKKRAEEEMARTKAEDEARAEAAEKAITVAEDKARAEAAEKAHIEAAKNQQLASSSELTDYQHNQTMARERPRTPPSRVDRSASSLSVEQSARKPPVSITGTAPPTSPGLASVAAHLNSAFQSAQTLEHPSAYKPLSLGLPSIEVRPVSPHTSGVNFPPAPPATRSQSSKVSQPPAPTLPSQSSLAGSAPSEGVRTPQQRTPDLNKEEQLKAQLLKKKVAIPDSTRSRQSSTTDTSTTHVSKSAAANDMKTPVAVSTNVPRATNSQAADKPISPIPRTFITTHLSSNGKTPVRTPGPPVVSAQAQKTGKAARKQGDGPTVMIKPEPSPSPPLQSPVVPSHPQAVPVAVPTPTASTPASTRPPVPSAKSTHALPGKSVAKPPPPKDANPKPASQPQAQARVRVSSGGDRSVRTPAASSSQGKTASQGAPPENRRSLVQETSAAGSQAKVVPDRLVGIAPLTARPDYVLNYHNLPLDEDAPWNVAIRDSFGPTDDHSGALLEERSRRSWDRYTPSPIRHSPRVRNDQYSPLSSPRSPRRDSFSPTRKRLREDDRERDFSPPPPRRARYSESSYEASPRQLDPLPGTGRARDYDRAVTPPYPYDYRSPSPQPTPARIEADTYRPYLRGPNRRTPPPFSYAPVPPRESIRQRPARSPIVDEYRRAAPLRNRITGAHRPVTPPRARSPSPQALMHRMAVPAPQEQYSRDPAPMDLLSRMTDAPAFTSRPPGGKAKANRAEAPPARRGRNDGKRHEGKQRHTDTHPAKDFSSRPGADSKKPLALRFTS